MPDRSLRENRPQDRWRDLYETASSERATWIRAFTRLEKAVTNHIKDRCIDSDDLEHVHRVILRDLAHVAKDPRS